MPSGRGFWIGPWGRFARHYGYQYWGRCRWFPWLPRWWWAGLYGTMDPYMIPEEQEITRLKAQIKVLEQELGNVNRRLEELKKTGE